MERLPNALTAMIDEYLLPSKAHTRALFDDVVHDLDFIVDPTVPIKETLHWIKLGLHPPVLRRHKGFYAQYHYLH